MFYKKRWQNQRFSVGSYEVSRTEDVELSGAVGGNFEDLVGGFHITINLRFVFKGTLTNGANCQSSKWNKSFVISFWINKFCEKFVVVINLLGLLVGKII